MAEIPLKATVAFVWPLMVKAMKKMRMVADMLSVR